MKKNRNHKWLWRGLFLIAVGFSLILLPFIFAKAQSKDSPTMSIFTFSNLSGSCEADTSLDWWDNWRDRATGSCSAGELYFGNCDSNFIFNYYNHSHTLELGSQRADLYAWWIAKGHVPCDSIFMKWKRNTIQYFDGYATFRPGWNPVVNDVNGNFHRDYSSDWDFNHNQVNFTVHTSSPYYIRDVGGGKSGVTWGTNTWQNAVVKLSTGTDADTTRLTCTSSKVDTIFLSGVPPSNPMWYVVSQGGDINAVAVVDTQARVGMYYYCEPSEPNCYPEYCSPALDFSLTDVQNFMGHDCAEILRAWRAIYSGCIGIHEDNVFTDWREDKIHSEDYGVGGGMGNLLEENLNSQEEYISAESLCNKHQHDSVHTVSGRVIIEGNIGNYQQDQYPNYMRAVRPLDAILYEGLMDMVPSPASVEAEIASCKATFEDAHDSSMQIYLMMKNSLWGDASDSLKRERFQRGMAVYHTIMGGHKSSRSSTANFLFLFDDKGYGGSTCEDTLEWWMSYAKFNLGTVQGICSTYTTNGNKFYYQRYTNGITVLYTGVDTASFPFGRYYHKVLYPGTLSTDSVTHYQMNIVHDGIYYMAMGRIFGISGTAPVDSLIQHLTPPTPLYPVNGSMIWGDKVDNLWGPPTDSVTLKVGTYNSFDSLFWKAHFTGVDSGGLSVSGLLENTTYYYSATAFEGSHQDVTEIASLTTGQAPISAVDKKIRRWRK